jgi:thymidylate synthase (FAD)
MTNEINHSNAYINLQEVSGGDLAIVNAARVSYGKSTHEMTDADTRLVSRLLRDRHGSPFEHASTRWYIRTPIFVAREWMRHRIGSFNEVSGRYKELTTDFYLPKKFRVPITGAKQMDYQYAPASEEQQDLATRECKAAFDQAEASYRKMLAAGIAKEHARIVLPLSLYTEFIWTVNSRALMNFLSLRNHKSAQGEIQMYAKAIEKVWGDVMPATHAAFVEHGRVSP